MGDPDADWARDEAWILQLYRGLAAEALMWRQRLDVTANWAIPLIVAVTTLALGESRLPHFVLLWLGWALILIAVFIEAHRYRIALHAAWRARLVEVGFFAARLTSSSPRSMAWRQQLAADLRRPVASLSFHAALKARFRSLYLVMMYLVFGAWLIKVLVHPVVARSMDEVKLRLRLGDIVPAWATAAIALTSLLALTLAVRRAPAREVVGEPLLEQRLEQRMDPPWAPPRDRPV